MQKGRREKRQTAHAAAAAAHNHTNIGKWLMLADALESIAAVL
jgi:hypothetical protein